MADIILASHPPVNSMAIRIRALEPLFGEVGDVTVADVLRPLTGLSSLTSFSFFIGCSFINKVRNADYLATEMRHNIILQDILQCIGDFIAQLPNLRSVHVLSHSNPHTMCDTIENQEETLAEWHRRCRSLQIVEF